MVQDSGLSCSVLIMFFFFQAEDGIRDLTVTGVQTCALPISDPGGERGRLWRAADRAGIDPDAASAETAGAGVLEFPGSSVRFRYPLLRSEIGRASCRERV